MRPTELLIFILIVGGIAFGLYNAAYGTILHYSAIYPTKVVAPNSSMLVSFNKTSEIYDITNEMESVATNMTQKRGWVAALGNVYDTGVLAFDAINVIFKIPGLLYDMVVDMNKIFNLPGWFTQMIIVIITVVIVLMGVSIVTRWNL